MKKIIIGVVIGLSVSLATAAIASTYVAQEIKTANGYSNVLKVVDADSNVLCYETKGGTAISCVKDININK